MNAPRIVTMTPAELDALAADPEACAKLSPHELDALIDRLNTLANADREHAATLQRYSDGAPAFRNPRLMAVKS